MKSSDTWGYISGRTYLGQDVAKPSNPLLIFMKDDFGRQLYIPTKEEQQASMCRIIASEMRRNNPELFDLTWLKVWTKQRKKTEAMVMRLKTFGA